ncbi:MAG: nicotinate phosphoribosyltransferase [Acidimicrobiales bacterium]
MTDALLSDLYGINMAISYLRRAMAAPATFSLFVRQLPPERGYLVAAGVDDCLEHLERFAFDPDDLGYLSSLGYPDDALDLLGAVRFTGDVWAVPEGSVVLADEPLLEVTAPIAEGQLVETYLLNRVTSSVTLATKASRCVDAAAGRFDLVEFGFRRAQGVDAAVAAARLAVMAGFVGTSNVEAARRFGLRPSGTMAHSYVEAFGDEVDAFTAFAEDIGGPVTFLVDTYDTASGVRRAIEVVDRLGLGETAAVRLDSGDLVALSRQTRQALDDAGLTAVRIFVSGGLDEYRIADLVAAGAPVDAAGVGTRAAVSADAPYVDSAFKLVEYDGRPVVKLSEGKRTLPGPKQVLRRPGGPDVIACRGEAPSGDGRPLLRPVMRGGRRAVAPDDLDTCRRRLQAERAALPSEARAVHHPRPPVAEHSARLRRLTEEVAAAAEERGRAAE